LGFGLGLRQGEGESELATRILIADDDDTILKAVARALSSAGFEVDMAHDAREVMDMASRQSYDVALIDYMLGRDNGLRVLGSLATMQPQCARAVMTSHRNLSPMDAVNVGQAEMVVLKRGVGLSQLVEMVQDLLRERSALAKNSNQAHEDGGLDTTRMNLERALEPGALKFVAQPIVRAGDPEATPFAYEALLRPRREHFDHVGELLQAVEHFATFHALGDRVFALASELIHKIPETSRLFINLHPNQLSGEDRLFGGLDELIPHAPRVVLEITERGILPPGWEQSIEKLKEAGFSIALDDFGGMFNGFTMLAELEPHFLKLDMSLVRNIHEEPRRKSLVSLITRFAEAEESPVIAEGVESEQEAEVLRACGVPFLQGYHYGRPEPYQ
jgi:EAL domain-containing protein (putative c-di-GMP-specific phosphodiesterase class I)/DNA-binding NarL/FixJ family response regulator